MSINSILATACPLIDAWVETNKPAEETSNQLSESFLENTKIEGSEAFIQKVEKLVKKASLLSSGSTTLQRALASPQMICIKEDLENAAETDSLIITLNPLTHTPHYVCLDSKGELVCFKFSKVILFLHELFHTVHHIENPDQKKNDREMVITHLPGMTNREEELTICGDLVHGEASKADFCCEWTVERELGKPLRINHLGINSVRGIPPTFKQMIEVFALGSIKENFPELVGGEVENDFHPLEHAFKYWFNEDGEAIKMEREKLLNFFIDSGLQSPLIFQMALLMRRVDLVEKMCKNGVELPKNAIKHALERFPEDKLDQLISENFKIKPVVEIPTSGENTEIIEKEKEKLKKYHEKINGSIQTLTSDQKLELVQLLLDAGAEVSSTDFNTAFLDKNYECAKLLAKAGFELSDLLYKSVPQMKLLLEYGFKPSQEMLSKVIQGRNSETASLLINEYGIKPSTRDWIWAILTGNKKNITLIEEVGYSPSSDKEVEAIFSKYKLTQEKLDKKRADLLK